MELSKPGSDPQTDRQTDSQDTHCPDRGQTLWSSDRKGTTQKKNTKHVFLACNELEGECPKNRLKFIVVTVLK